MSKCFILRAHLKAVGIRNFSRVSSFADILIWHLQQDFVFAILFFFRLPVDGCIGRRFFQSAAHINLLNEMKQRLIEVADFHHAASKALKVESPAEGSERSLEKASCSSDYLTSPELHKELVR